MEQTSKLKPDSSALLVFILTVGVFGIINTEMGVIGILPLIAETFHVTVPQAGWTVSIFALVVAISAPVMPLLFSGINRKKVMLLALGIFTLSNVVSMFTSNFTVLLIARALPASGLCVDGFYCSCCIRQQEESSESSSQSLYRCLCRNGVGSTGDQLYCK